MWRSKHPSNIIHYGTCIFMTPNLNWFSSGNNLVLHIMIMYDASSANFGIIGKTLSVRILPIISKYVFPWYISITWLLTAVIVTVLRRSVLKVSPASVLGPSAADLVWYHVWRPVGQEWGLAGQGVGPHPKDTGLIWAAAGPVIQCEDEIAIQVVATFGAGTKQKTKS